MAEAHIMDEEPPLDSAGQALRRAREAEGLGLAEIAERTKIPERHLLAIEEGKFAALPARAYAVGFSRTYARAVGLDEAEIARRVRDQLDGAPEPSARTVTFEPGDPARIPSPRFAWLGAILALGVIAAGFLFWRSYYSPAGELPPIVADAPAPSPAPPPAPAAVSGEEVTFTALQPRVWVKFSDGSGQQLFQKELAQGETYTLPPTAQGATIATAHPEALAITVGGRPVAKLAEAQRTLRDVPVSAAVLLARASPPPPVIAASPAPRSSVRRSQAAPSAAPPARPVPAAAPATSAPATSAAAPEAATAPQ